MSFLLRNGYTENRQTGSHLILKNRDGKSLVVPVHRGKDLPKGLFLRILKDAGFTLEDFREGWSTLTDLSFHLPDSVR